MGLLFSWIMCWLNCWTKWTQGILKLRKKMFFLLTNIFIELQNFICQWFYMICSFRPSLFAPVSILVCPLMLPIFYSGTWSHHFYPRFSLLFLNVPTIFAQYSPPLSPNVPNSLISVPFANKEKCLWQRE